MIDPTARISPTATIAADAEIGPNVTVGERAVIGSGTRSHGQCCDWTLDDRWARTTPYITAPSSDTTRRTSAITGKRATL